MSLYPVNFNVRQVTLNNTQVCCLQLAQVNGLKKMICILKTLQLCGLHSTLGWNVTPGMTYGVYSLRF